MRFNNIKKKKKRKENEVIIKKIKYFRKTVYKCVCVSKF